MKINKTEIETEKVVVEKKDFYVLTLTRGEIAYLQDALYAAKTSRVGNNKLAAERAHKQLSNLQNNHATNMWWGTDVFDKFGDLFKE